MSAASSRRLWLTCVFAVVGVACGDADGIRERLRHAYCAELPNTTTETHFAIVRAKAVVDMAREVPQEQARLCAAMVFELSAGEVSLRVAESRAASLASTRAGGTDVAASGATLNLSSTEWRSATREARDICLRSDVDEVDERLDALERRTNDVLVAAQGTCRAAGFIARAGP